jgi:amidophosphoribosyltransferase
MGHGDAFVLRDPSGIRPAFYYIDDEIICCASERPAIQTAINAPFRDVHEVPPGAALIVKKDGSFSIKQIIEPAQTPTPCSFERIYFSRGNDRAIYTERKKLGELLAESTLQKVHYNFKNTVFSFIPNTAETAYLGLIQGVEQACNRIKTEKLTELLKQPITTNLEHEINEIVKVRPRFEKLISKDVKMRTFIAEDSSRNELVSHVYDVTYGIINNHKDTVVLIDDSIVRGTTLKMSILRMTNRLLPKKIIVLSSAPQIRYPDCYGIDMSKLKEFVAFQAMIQLLKEKDLQHKIDEAYQKCKASLDLPLNEIVNEIKPLYDLLDYEEVSQKIGKMITPPDFDIEVEIIYQTIEGLHIACPNNHGDWYFTGNYPTSGGNRVANRAFVYFYEGLDKRAY